MPAGLDISAVTPEEIALSILAEIVQLRRTGAIARRDLPDSPTTVAATQAGVAAVEDAEVHPPAPAPALAFTGERALRPGETVRPTCGMIVEIATATHHSDYGGHTYTFCCPQCKRRFEKDPEKFLARMAAH